MANSETSPETLDVPHEVVPNLETTKKETFTLETEINNQVARYDATEAGLKVIAEKYTGLSIAGIEDRAGYKKVEQAWQEVRGIRIKIEKTRKLINEDYLQITRAVNGKAKDLTAIISPLETQLNNELERIDGLKKAEADKAEREAQERLQGRVATLLDNGVKFSGQFYTIGETISLDVVTLKALTDPEFSGLLEKVQAENQKIKDAQAEIERQEREQREALQRQKDEQEAERKRLQKEADDLKAEREQMKRQRHELRIKSFQSIGFILSNDQKSLLWSRDAGYILIPVADFENITGDEFDAMWEQMQKDLANLRQLQAEKEEEKQREKLAEKQRVEAENARRSVLLGLGMKEENGSFFIHTESFGESNFHNSATILNLDEAAWQLFINDISADITETLRQDQKNMDTRARVVKREADVERLEMVFSSDCQRYARTSKFEGVPEISLSLEDLEKMEDGNWAVRLGVLNTGLKDIKAAEAKAEQAQKEQAEAERLAQLSEVEQVREYMKRVMAAGSVNVPQLSGDVLKAFVSYRGTVITAEEHLIKALGI